MERSFVEDLWEKNPELVLKAIKKIAELDNYKLEFVEFEDSCLKFEVYNEDAEYIFDIYLNDFYISTSTSCEDFEISKYDVRWMKFMYKICGNLYAMQYISKRNQQLDKYMAEYEEKYNNQTRKVLDEMGFQVNKGQTK